MTEPRATPAPALHGCAACQGPLGPVRWVCAGCQAPLHAGCQAGLDRCPTPGCGAARWSEVDRRPGRSSRAPLAWIAVLLLSAAAVGLSCALHLALSPRAAHQAPVVQRWAVPAQAVAAPPVDLSHVRPGQEWVFALYSNGTAMEQVYRVVAVGPGAVSCMLRLRMDQGAGMQDVGQEFPFDWTYAPLAPPGPALPRETVVAAGQSWPCEVHVGGDGSRTWVPLRGGSPTFPQYIQIDSPQTRSWLVEVRGPQAPGGG